MWRPKDFLNRGLKVDFVEIINSLFFVFTFSSEEGPPSVCGYASHMKVQYRTSDLPLSSTILNLKLRKNSCGG